MTLQNALPNLEPQLTESQKLSLNLITLNTKCNDLDIGYRKLNAVVLLGEDGELPLRETVRNHTAFIDGIKYWSRLIGGALILQTIAFGAAVIVAYVKFLPVLEKLANQASP